MTFPGTAPEGTDSAGLGRLFKGDLGNAMRGAAMAKYQSFPLTFVLHNGKRLQPASPSVCSPVCRHGRLSSWEPGWVAL
jgi:hypothetical protein